ncbi:helix-turn-helix DNA binding domain protein [Gordonia phage Thimann]|nr:helix-turn-helix DNA binding domain protein [Gordonia phage Thimann]
MGGSSCRHLYTFVCRVLYMDHYTTSEREAQGKKLAKARATADEALRIAKLMAQSAHHQDGVPETQIAKELGVDRMTVRKWLGKR